MAKVTGIGGVFLKCRGDRAALAAWYQQHLGLPLETWGGAVLRWPDDKAGDQGLTVWSLADRDSQWFSPSESAYMINYRVDDLDALLAQLRAADVEVVGERSLPRFLRRRARSTIARAIWLASFQLSFARSE